MKDWIEIILAMAGLGFMSLLAVALLLAITAGPIVFILVAVKYLFL